MSPLSEGTVKCAGFLPGGFGSLLLAAALRRAHVAPVWAAVCLPLGLIGSIAAQAAGSRPTLIVAALVLLGGLGRIALEPPQHATAAVAAGTA